MARIATILKGYPRLSETFIAQEILGLEKRGINQLIISLRHPTDPQIHKLHKQIDAELLYLPEYLKDDPTRVGQGKRWAKSQPGFSQAREQFERDFERDHSINRLRRWGQACVLAHELPGDITHLHSHFLHTPASVTRYAASILGLTWSFSAHAKDIWTSPEWELREKLSDAEWGVTCTRVNQEHLCSLASDKDRVSLVYHGLDFTHFPTFGPKNPTNHGRSEPVQIVSVGRAVDKKGYPDLLAALARLKEMRWKFTHIGSGSTDKLKAQANRLGIANRCTWKGPQARQTVIETITNSDIFVLASRITKNGDRDGIPNVLMEAQALGVVCIATNVSAIPELISHGENGLLADERSPIQLATAIKSLITNPEQRFLLAETARTRLQKHFSSENGFAELTRLFSSYI